MAGPTPAGVFALAAALTAALAGPAPADAQAVICCNQLIDIDGAWIGAARDCAGELELATPVQRQAVCEVFQSPAAMCPDAEPWCDPCDGSEASKLDPDDRQLLGPEDPVVQGLVDGLADFGVANVGPQHLLAEDSPRHARIRFTIRLDENSCLLVSGSCVLWAGSQGLIPEGKQDLASRLLFGSIQRAGKKLRITARIVDVETGVWLDAAQATVRGSAPLAVANAFADVLAQLDMPCLEARTLEF